MLKTTAALLPAKARKLDAPPSVKLYFGPPGTGKSWLANAELPGAYIKPDGRKWWPNYTGQKTVIIDDFAPQNHADKKGDYLELDDFLRVLDCYEMQVEYKGGYTQMMADTFIICSNFTPQQWYPGHPHLPALLRRIKELVYFPTKWTPAELPRLPAQQAMKMVQVGGGAS